MDEIKDGSLLTDNFLRELLPAFVPPWSSCRLGQWKHRLDRGNYRARYGGLHLTRDMLVSNKRTGMSFGDRPYKENIMFNTRVYPAEMGDCWYGSLRLLDVEPVLWIGRTGPYGGYMSQALLATGEDLAKWLVFEYMHRHAGTGKDLREISMSLECRHNPPLDKLDRKSVV